MTLAELLARVAMLVASVVVTAEAPAVRVSLPPSTTAPASSSCPQWYGLALDVGWSADDWDTLDRVMWCESKCGEREHNPSGASGLLQIMPLWWHGRDPYDPAVNLTMGLEVRQQQGWRAWSCY